MRAEGFSCCLDALYESLGISALQFWIKKKKKSAVFFKIIFSHQNPGSGLDPDPDSLELLDPDPQHCLCSAKKGSVNGIKFVSLL